MIEKENERGEENERESEDGGVGEGCLTN